MNGEKKEEKEKRTKDNSPFICPGGGISMTGLPVFGPPGSWSLSHSCKENIIRNKTYENYFELFFALIIRDRASQA